MRAHENRRESPGASQSVLFLQRGESHGAEAKPRSAKSQVRGWIISAIRAHEFMKTLSRTPSPRPVAAWQLRRLESKAFGASLRAMLENTSQSGASLLLTVHGMKWPFRGTHPNIHLHHFVQRNPYNLHPKIIGCFVKCSMGTLGGHTK